MTKASLQMIVIALVLILVQVIILNRICLFGVAVPIAFIYILFRLPVTLSKEWLFTIAFFVGFTIDVFSDMGGVNTLSCLIMAQFRRPILHLYFPRDDELTDPFPSISSLGLAVYFKYVLTLTGLYCMLAFTFESLSFFRIWHLIQCIMASTALSTALIIGIDYLILPRREKRL